MSSRREHLIDGAVDYVLEHGIGDLSLRPLAHALGTSDRMLLYYFTDRDELVTVVLERVGDDLDTMVQVGLPPGRCPPEQVLGSMSALLGAGVSDPRLRLWLEVAGLAARGREPFASIADRVIGRWIEALAERLDVDDPETVATALLTVADGAMLLAALGHEARAAAGAAWLLDRIAGRP